MMCVSQQIDDASGSAAAYNRTRKRTTPTFTHQQQQQQLQTRFRLQCRSGSIIVRLSGQWTINKESPTNNYNTVGLVLFARIASTASRKIAIGDDLLSVLKVDGRPRCCLFFSVYNGLQLYARAMLDTVICQLERIFNQNNHVCLVCVCGERWVVGPLFKNSLRWREIERKKKDEIGTIPFLW